jgi:hypothetical protein
MTSEPSDGPEADAITGYISETYPDAVIGHDEGATFFSLDDSHWPNFATIVTGEAFDDGSDLSRPGVFRLNIGALSRETFQRLVGGVSEPDFTELDRLLPHPVYAKQRWVAIVNPSARSFEEIVKPLIGETHDRVAAQHVRGF